MSAQNRIRITTLISPRAKGNIQALMAEWQLPMGRVIDRLCSERATPRKSGNQLTSYAQISPENR